MNIPETYDYLVRARQNLWAGLQAVPDEVLSRPLLNGDKFRCIKDPLFHVAATEDFWIREEILRVQPVRQTIPALKDTQGGPVFAVPRSKCCWTTGGLWSRAPSLTSPRLRTAS
jgi:hypothetical protein